MSNKLQNIKAIKQMLTGEHKSQRRKSTYFGKNYERFYKIKAADHNLSDKDLKLSQDIKLDLINSLSKSSGHSGIAGGQYLDLNY